MQQVSLNYILAFSKQFLRYHLVTAVFIFWTISEILLPFPSQFVLWVFWESSENCWWNQSLYSVRIFDHFDHSIMEDMCLRTPHILEQINELLDDKSLVKCKKASRIMNTIIEKQKCEKYLTTRMIQSYIKNSKEFADWRIIFQKLPMKQLNKFGILVTDFYKSFPPRIKYRSWLPINIAADRGHLKFCRFCARVSVTKSY